MTILSRPDTDVFASAAQSGEVGDYPAWLRGFGKLFDPGQTDGIPTMEQFNYIIKTLNEGFAYLAQRGIAEWLNVETYPSGAFCQYGGKLYQARRNNTNVVPGTSEDDWGLFKAGSATGGGRDAVFYLNDQVITEDYTIPVGQNAGTFGKPAIADGATVSISDGSTWSIT